MTPAAGKPISRIRPRVAVLWNGVTLEELGIADLLKSADLTLTCGRTTPSVKHPVGKPKVGGATLEFIVPNEASALRLKKLLEVDERPFLTMGFGYHGSQSYWLGDVGVRRKPDMKKFSVVRGYKVDNVTWSYPAGVATLKINGMAGRACSLVEHRRATVWTGKTLADIAKGIADEHGITIRITGQVPANHRLEHAVQLAGESRLEALQRLFLSSGGLMRLSTEALQETPGAVQAYQYVFEGKGGGATIADQTFVRTVLTISAIHEEFVDLAGQEAREPIIIGYNPSGSPSKFGFGLGNAAPETFTRDGHASGVPKGGYSSPPTYLATKVEVAREGFARGRAKVAGIGRKGSVQTGSELKPGPAGAPGEESSFKAPGALSSIGKVAATVVEWFSSSGDETKMQVESPPDGTDVPVSAAHDDLGGKMATEAKAKAVTAAHVLKTKLTLGIVPGAPELEPGQSFLLRGTYAHDGWYGIEEARNTLTRDGGLATNLTCRPVSELGVGAGSGKKLTSQAQQPGSPVGAASPVEAAAPTEGLGFTSPGALVSVGKVATTATSWFFTEQQVGPAPVASDEVPAAPPSGGAQLEAEIREVSQ